MIIATDGRMQNFPKLLIEAMCPSIFSVSVMLFTPRAGPVLLSTRISRFEDTQDVVRRTTREIYSTMPEWVSAFAPQLFSFDRVRCTRAIRPYYFLIRQGEMGRARALKDEVLGSKGDSSNLAQCSRFRCEAQLEPV